MTGSRRAANAWALAQAARDPYVILITIYIFVPYFVTRVVGDPVAGQTLIASANKWGGWSVFLTAPWLGAFIDRVGPRKPFLAAIVATMATLVALLWFVPPGGGGIGIAAVVLILGVMTWLMSMHELAHNALLLPAAGLSGTARASGLGLAGGNAMSVAMLVAVLFAFALPGKVDWGWLPAQPLLGLDAARGEPDRITAPIVAAMLVLGSIRLFLKVPDWPRTGLSIPQAARAAGVELVRLFREVRGLTNPLTFLLARMIYTDGLTLILLFGGLFAAGQMRWGTLEMLGYGIILSVAAVIGGVLAGRLDNAIGPRPAVLLELSLLFVMQGLTLGMGRERILYRPYAGTALWDGPMFTTLPEIVFLMLGCGMAITVTAAYASSRTLLVRITPPDRLGVLMGLYVLSGYATMWAGPLLVEQATRWGGSQAWGLTPVLLLLTAGFLVLTRVQGGGRL